MAKTLPTSPGSTAGTNDRSPTIASSSPRHLDPERARLIFDSTNLGIGVSDMAGILIDANPAFCHMLEYELSEVIGMNSSQISHPDDWPATQQVRAEISRGGDSSFEKRYLSKHGKTVWARVVASPIKDASGNVTSLFAIVENITARKLAQEELRKSEERNLQLRDKLLAEVAASEQRLRYITRASLDLIWDWDLLSGHIWWGEGLQTLFGFTNDMMGTDEKFWLRRAHRDDREKMRQSFYSTLSGSQDGWKLQFRIKKLDGNFTLVEERAFALRDDHGKTVRIVGGVTDISSRIELEEQLRQAQRLESLGQLTGGVAHDFNNLLTVMLGNAELLADELDTQPRLQELAQIIARSALQGADLTHRLLAFARRQALEPKNVNLNHLVENMGRILVRTLGEEIRLHIHPAEPLWLCVVDPIQMESAILNLCLNARDAMPNGGSLTLETNNVSLDTSYTEKHFDLQPGDYVSLAISDTGIGIAPANLEHVLEPFFTTKPKGKGTGLGLSTTFGFIKQSFGHLNIYSELGHGTTVRIYLPRTNPGAVEDFTQPHYNKLVGKGTETILMVEDDDMVRQYAHTLLLSLGYTVLAAANGADALDIIREHDNIALLFTDVIMPGGMGGRQLAEAACKLRPGLKVLYTSGYTENSIVHNGRLDAGVHLLGKPYQRHELAHKLREILEG